LTPQILIHPALSRGAARRQVTESGEGEAGDGEGVARLVWPGAPSERPCVSSGSVVVGVGVVVGRETEGVGGRVGEGLAGIEAVGSGDRSDDVGSGDRPDAGSLEGGTGSAPGPACGGPELDGTSPADGAGGVTCVGARSLSCPVVAGVSTDGRKSAGVGPPVRPIARIRRHPPPTVVRAMTPHTTHVRGCPECPTKTGLRARWAERLRVEYPTGLSCSASMLTRCASPPVTVPSGRRPGQSFPRERRPRCTRYACTPRDAVAPRR
jgi:hypothetical protein